MKDLNKRDDLVHATKSMEDILALVESEERSITPEEATQFKALEARCVELDAEIEAQEAEDAAAEARKAQVTARKDKLAQPETRKTAPIDPEAKPAEQRVSRIQPVSRCGKLKGFKGPDAELRALISGHWLRHHITKDPESLRFLQDHVSEESRALAGNNNVKGGTLVPIEMSNAIIDLQFEYGVFRQHATVWPMSSDTLEIPRDSSAIAVVYATDGDSATTTDAAFDVVNLVAKKAMGVTYYSNELGDDAIINMADLLVTKYARAFAKAEDDAGFNGTGALATYGGHIGLNPLFDEDGFGNPVVVLAGAIPTDTGETTFASLDINDLANLMGACPSYALPNAKFFCSSQFNAQVFDQIKAAAGGNTMMDLEGKPTPAYLGHPIIISEVMPTSATDTENMVLFGDLSMSSAFGSRSDIQVDVSDQERWGNDQIAVRGKERFNIVNHDVGDATNAGPIVGLHSFTT